MLLNMDANASSQTISKGLETNEEKKKIEKKKKETDRGQDVQSNLNCHSLVNNYLQMPRKYTCTAKMEVLRLCSLLSRLLCCAVL